MTCYGILIFCIRLTPLTAMAQMTLWVVQKGETELAYRILVLVTATTMEGEILA